MQKREDRQPHCDALQVLVYVMQTVILRARGARCQRIVPLARGGSSLGTQRKQHEANEACSFSRDMGGATIGLKLRFGFFSVSFEDPSAQHFVHQTHRMFDLT